MIFSIIIVFEVLFLYILRNCGIVNEINQTLIVSINVVLLLFFIVKKQNISRQEKIILIFALLIRVVFLFVDEFIYRLPFNSGDATRFEKMAQNIANDMTILNEDYIYGGVYSKFLGILCYCFGNIKIIAEFINVFLSIATIYFIFEIMKKVDFKSHKKELFLKVLVAFFPINMILSISLLRESTIVFFIILSLKCCLDYIETNKVYKIFISFVAILIAGMLHAGSLFINEGYILIFAFYNSKENKIKMSLRNIIKFMITNTIIILIIVQFSSLFAAKLVKGIETEDTIESVNMERSFIKNNPITRALEKHSDAGSSYLRNRTVNSIVDIVVFSVERVVYFLFSPMPWDWRGPKDAIVFLMDSMLYIVLTIRILTSFRKMNKVKLILVIFLILGLAMDLVVFALGTSTAGTALRHRNKLLYYILILSILCNNEKERKLDA